MRNALLTTLWGACVIASLPEIALAAPPAEPLPISGSFEEPSPGDATRPYGWYYLQQAKLIEASDAPDGRRFLRFSNAVPGRTAQAQQHLALDGRWTRSLEVSVAIATRDVAPGQSLAERAAVRIHFYDEADVEIGHENVGPWSGTREWSRETASMAVPEPTRMILVVVGLGGGTGEADFDELVIVPATLNPTALPRRIGK